MNKLARSVYLLLARRSFVPVFGLSPLSSTLDTVIDDLSRRKFHLSFLSGYLLHNSDNKKRKTWADIEIHKVSKRKQYWATFRDSFLIQ
jgi:hypothetical protein